MTYMELEFPGDADEARVRSRRNMSDVERWLSIAAGTGLALYGLSRRKSAGWFLAAMGGMLLQRGASGHCHTYEALGINTAGTGEDTRRALGGSAGTHVDESVTINRPIEELYRFWRNLENLPQFMQHLESVERVTDTLSRWRAHGPGGKIVEWNAEIINEVPNKVIGWRSIEGSDVVSAGSVNFDDAGPGRGTRVRVRLQYSPPGGKVGAAVARMLGRDAATEIREDLRRFKQILETGEVPSTKDSLAGETSETGEPENRRMKDLRAESRGCDGAGSHSPFDQFASSPVSPVTFRCSVWPRGRVSVVATDGAHCDSLSRPRFGRSPCGACGPWQQPRRERHHARRRCGRQLR